MTLRNRPSFPRDFNPTHRTPKGGASCANCVFYDPSTEKGPHGICLNSYYHDWTGLEGIPGPPDQYVSMWWEGETPLPPWEKTNGQGKKHVGEA